MVHDSPHELHSPIHPGLCNDEIYIMNAEHIRYCIIFVESEL